MNDKHHLPFARRVVLGLDEAEAELLRRHTELSDLTAKLTLAQEQLLQSEKLASIGQLAAGVAHEINNPISYVFSNFATLGGYIDGVLEMLAAYQAAEQHIADPKVLHGIRALRASMDIDFVTGDIPVLMGESREGIERVRKIVQDLKDFSRADAHQEWQWSDLHHGLDSTLNIVANEVKYRADIVKEYGDIPDIECLPSQLNQVFMNIIINAAQAMTGQRGRITIRTARAGEMVRIDIADNGGGIPKAIQGRIFDPFFTTKPTGSGTGLGLSLSYGIVQKHHGRIELDSPPGGGATFSIFLPVRHDASADSNKDQHP